jgi:type II secretory pathway component PulF
MDDSADSETANRRPLSLDQQAVVAEVVAQAAEAQLPLPTALLAAAEDMPSMRTAATLRQLAAQLQQGRSLDDPLHGPPRRLSAYVAGLIRGGQGGGDLGATLMEWINCRRAVRQTWRSVIAAILYPAVLVILLIAVIGYMDALLVGPMLEMYEDWQLTLPASTKLLAWAHRHFLPTVLGSSFLALVVLVLFRLLAGAARWRRSLTTIPLLGMLWYWIGVMEWSRLLAVLLRRQLPLPEALELAADGVQDANMRDISQRLAMGVQRGTPLSELIDATYRLPATLVPLVRWGERTGRLAEAFDVAGQIYEGRSRMRADLLAALLPPLVFVAVATVIPLFLVGLYMPMVGMIQGLS